MKCANSYIGSYNEKIEGIRITKIHNNNWIDGLVDNCFFQAKVFSEPSEYGLYNGRISKLVICDSIEWDYKKVIYHYDRGFDHATKRGIKFSRKLLKVFPRT